MPLGINNPLVRRVKGHASMSVLFRAIEPRIGPPKSRSQLPYVPPIVSTGVIPSADEAGSPSEELSPLQQAVVAAEKPAPVAPRTQGTPTISRRQESPPAQAPVPGPAETPGESLPAIQQQPEQPATQQPVSPPSKEDQDWEGSWGRLRNIFQRQQEKRALEDPQEESEQAEPAKPAPEQPRTIAEVQRSLSEREAKGPVRRRRSTVEYITPEEAAKPIALPQSKPSEAQSFKEPETDGADSPQETVGASSATSEIQAERQPDLPDMVLPEKSDLAEPTAADVSDIDQPGLEPEASVRREPDLPDMVSTEMADSAETTAADVSDIEQSEIKPEVSVQREPETTGQPPSLDVDKQSVAAVGEPKGETEEPKAKEITQAAAAAELPEPKSELDQPTPIVGTELDRDLIIQKSEAPPTVTKHIPEPSVQPAEIETSTLDMGAQLTSEIEPEAPPEPGQPPEQEEGFGQRLLGAARRLLRYEAESEKPEPAKDLTKPVVQVSSSPEPIQKMPESEPASAEDKETGHALPEDADQLQAEDEVAIAIAQAERPTEQSTSLPPVSEQEASVGQILPSIESAVQPMPLQREVDKTGKTAETPELTESSVASEQPQAEQATPESGEDLGPVVQALPATDSIDIIRRVETQPAPDIKTKADPVSPQPEVGKISETPMIEEESSSLEMTGDAEETLIVSPSVLEGKQETQAMSLEQAWPVRQVEPADTVAPAPEAKSPDPSAELVVQRRPAGGDESASQVEEALRHVQPSEKSDSAVELVTPRRPRPTISRTPKPESPKAVTEQPAPESPAPVEASRQASPQMPDSDSPADTTSVQRSGEEAEEGEDLPAPSSGPTRAPPAGTRMVPTKIGDLPSDFWEILGQKPPEAAQPAPIAKPTNGGLQRTPAPAGDVSAAIAHAESPTYEHPPLETFIQREWSAPSVQRDALTSSSESDVSDASPAEISTDTQEAKTAPGGEVDVDKLAEAVYRQLKRRLSVERERGRGRF